MWVTLRRRLKINQFVRYYISRGLAVSLHRVIQVTHRVVKIFCGKHALVFTANDLVPNGYRVQHSKNDQIQIGLVNTNLKAAKLILIKISFG